VKLQACRLELGVLHQRGPIPNFNMEFCELVHFRCGLSDSQSAATTAFIKSGHAVADCSVAAIPETTSAASMAAAAVSGSRDPPPSGPSRKKQRPVAKRCSRRQFTQGFTYSFLTDRKKQIFGVWAAPGGRETFQNLGSRKEGFVHAHIV